MRRPSHVLRFATLALAAWLAAPATALACWDGTYARIGRVEVMEGDLGWEPARARELATWLARIDALVPPDGSVTSEFGFVTVCRDGASCAEHRWSGRSLARLFRIVAEAYGSSAAEVRRARSLSPEVWTVQVAATRDEGDAERIASRLNESDAGEHGFYEVGGFPALNPRAHVVRARDAAGHALYRVVVGAFPTHAEAEAHAAELSGALAAPTLAREL